MLIKNKVTDGKGIFYVEQDDEIVAEMTYNRPSPDKMIIQHTEVSEKLKGQNIGKQLVHHAVEFARSHNIKIVPHCSYANSVLKKTPAYADVLFKS